ncbi:MULTISPECIES: DUF4408 domain-containing protein [Listeria]|uniref:DUF4408 domain-containing protein n=1 Tax=Listeria TaxID=1637 RepID=UPI000B593A29|nr:MULTISPECIES: DUF4408 domain-containing protein [Listeria]
MYLFTGLFVFALFSNFIAQFIPIGGILENGIVLVFLIAAFFKAVYESAQGKKSISGSGIFLIGVIFLLFIVAMSPNAFSLHQNTLINQLLTFFSMVKFVLLYLSGQYLFQNIELTSTKSFFTGLARFITLSCLAVYIINFFIPLLQPFDMRFDRYTYSFGFGHPAQFALVILILSSLATFFKLIDQKKPPYLYLALNFILIFIAGRSTSIGFYLCLYLLLLLFPYLKRIPIAIIALLGGGFIWLNADRIMNQLIGNTQEARGLLLRTSFKIAQDYFPFGGGLGMFGSHAARVNYSPYYAYYNLDSVWGLAPSNPQFATDSYWAMLLGEVGFLGCLLMIILFVALLITITKNLPTTDIKLKFIVILPLVYALITSPIDTTLVSKSIVVITFSVLYMRIFLQNKKPSIKC